MCSRCSPRLCICAVAAPRCSIGDVLFAVLVGSGTVIALCGALPWLVAR
jgi:hypothetical protein